ncbi:MAG: hypothetical protein ACJA08_003508 [Cyclobacteriaceae bacterium]|jgi:hypothetical protein
MIKRGILSIGIRQMNPAFAKYHGKSIEELVNKKDTSIFTTIEVSWLSAFACVDQTGETINFQNYGGEYDKHYHVTAWKIAKNTIGVSRIDTTDRKQAEAELKLSNLKLAVSEEQLR